MPLLFPLLLVSIVTWAGCGDDSPLGAELERSQQAPLASAEPDAEVVAAVDRTLGAGELEAVRWGNLRDVIADLRVVYADQADRLVWFDVATPVAKLEPALAVIARAGDYGLDPGDYDAAQLAAQWPAIKSRSASARDRAAFDLTVSIAAARMIRAVHAGRVDPAAMRWNYAAAAKTTDIAGSLRRAAATDDLGAVLDSLEPQFAHYQRAKKKLAFYKATAMKGEPPVVPELAKGSTKIAPGQAWAGVPQLIARLTATGDVSAESAAAATPAAAAEPPPQAGSPPAVPVYEGALVDSVKRFQERHGLGADGVIGATTIKALNVPLARRARQLELAMERGRWLPDLSDRPNVFVNVALFRLWATDPVSGEESLRMNVVVGKALNTQTPIFVDQMEYVVFRPYWNPPPSIITGEIVPALRKDPSYLNRQNMEIVASGADDAASLPASEDNIAKVASGRLFVRQRPGPSNSLGLAKFIFPNSENVYMHGTPARQLFSRTRRDFSHGCIRLEDPARFAEWVLRQDPSWTRERIDAAMQGDKTMQVNLKEKLAVVVFYDTVHVNSEQTVFFVDDIYGHDKALDAALQRGYPFPVTPAASTTSSAKR
ncbi:MAG: L,D-transpeptidase family protein [Vicinamibacterales bacterium]|jgi:murein L,D-transpeptidase YcbB/YkuD